MKDKMKAQSIADLTWLSIKTVEKAFCGKSISKATFDKIAKHFRKKALEYLKTT